MFSLLEPLIVDRSVSISSQFKLNLSRTFFDSPFSIFCMRLCVTELSFVHKLKRRVSGEAMRMSPSRVREYLLHPLIL